MRREVIAGILILLTTIFTVAGAFYYESYLTRGKRTIELLARAPEIGNWNKNEITIRYGEPVRLRIRNVDTVSHGFAIPELGVGLKEIKAGEVGIIELNPVKLGTFTFTCTVWCSDRHIEMRGKLSVLNGVVNPK